MAFLSEGVDCAGYPPSTTVLRLLSLRLSIPPPRARFAERQPNELVRILTATLVSYPNQVPWRSPQLAVTCGVLIHTLPSDATLRQNFDNPCPLISCIYAFPTIPPPLPPIHHLPNNPPTNHHLSAPHPHPSPPIPIPLPHPPPPFPRPSGTATYTMASARATSVSRIVALPRHPHGDLPAHHPGLFERERSTHLEPRPPSCSYSLLVVQARV